MIAMRVIQIPDEDGAESVIIVDRASSSSQIPTSNPTRSSTTITTASQTQPSEQATTESTITDNREVLFDAASDVSNEDDDPAQKEQDEQRAPWMSAKHYRDQLPPPGTRCALLPSRMAVWEVRGTDIKLSALSAAILINEGKLNEGDLEVFHDVDSKAEDAGPSDPISGIVAAVHSTLGGVVMGIADYPVEISKMIHSDREVAKTLASEFALDSGKGISRIIGTGLRAPMDFTSNISRGFGNLPKLYGDEVRKEERVTDLGSGLGGAVKGLGYGLFDGITGLVTQPVKGAQEGGVGGFFTGLGKGIGGAVFKPAAGALNVPASAFKGIYEEIQSARRSSKQDQTFKKQIEQGKEEWEMCSVDERAAILGMWYEDV